MADTTVTTAAIPGASVFVAAGTLMDQQGTPFDGVPGKYDKYFSASPGEGD